MSPRVKIYTYLREKEGNDVSFVLHEAPKVDLSRRHMGVRSRNVAIDYKLWIASVSLQPLENDDSDVRV